MPHIHRVLLLSCIDSRSKLQSEGGDTTKRLTTEGSSHSKRISTDAILALTSLPNSFMDVVASLMHDPLPKRLHRSRTCSKVKVHTTPTIVPRNLKPRNLILGALSSFSRKFPPTKITRYTVCKVTTLHSINKVTYIVTSEVA